MNEQIGAQASKFEVLTSTAIMIFKKVKLDIAVKDAGMDGRPDAIDAMPDTLVASAPTSIDSDYQGFLGNAVAEIA